MAEHTPLVVLDAVHPKVIQALLAIPATEKVDHVVDWIEAHGMTTARRWHIAVCICAVESFPDCVRLRGMQIRIE
jgi:hypothetical protein